MPDFMSIIKIIPGDPAPRTRIDGVTIPPLKQIHTVMFATLNKLDIDPNPEFAALPVYVAVTMGTPLTLVTVKNPSVGQDCFGASLQSPLCSGIHRRTRRGKRWPLGLRTQTVDQFDLYGNNYLEVSEFDVILSCPGITKPSVRGRTGKCLGLGRNIRVSVEYSFVLAVGGSASAGDAKMNAVPIPPAEGFL